MHLHWQASCSSRKQRTTHRRADIGGSYDGRTVRICPEFNRRSITERSNRMHKREPKLPMSRESLGHHGLVLLFRRIVDFQFTYAESPTSLLFVTGVKDRTTIPRSSTARSICVYPCLSVANKANNIPPLSRKASFINQIAGVAFASRLTRCLARLILDGMDRMELRDSSARICVICG